MRDENRELIRRNDFPAVRTFFRKLSLGLIKLIKYRAISINPQDHGNFLVALSFRISLLEN